jgi:hypothetical protein
MHDLEYQNASDIVGARWHGFMDTGSGIKNYYWCVGNTSTTSLIHSSTECSIKKWENVGIHTSVSRSLGKELVFGNGVSFHSTMCILHILKIVKYYILFQFYLPAIHLLCK